MKKEAELRCVELAIIREKEVLARQIGTSSVLMHAVASQGGVAATGGGGGLDPYTEALVSLAVGKARMESLAPQAPAIIDVPARTAAAQPTEYGNAYNRVSAYRAAESATQDPHRIVQVESELPSLRGGSRVYREPLLSPPEVDDGDVSQEERGGEEGASMHVSFRPDTALLMPPSGSAQSSLGDGVHLNRSSEDPTNLSIERSQEKATTTEDALSVQTSGASVIPVLSEPPSVEPGATDLELAAPISGAGANSQQVIVAVPHLAAAATAPAVSPPQQMIVVPYQATTNPSSPPPSAVLVPPYTMPTPSSPLPPTLVVSHHAAPVAVSQHPPTFVVPPQPTTVSPPQGTSLNTSSVLRVQQVAPTQEESVRSVSPSAQPWAAKMNYWPTSAATSNESMVPASVSGPLSSKQFQSLCTGNNPMLASVSPEAPQVLEIQSGSPSRGGSVVPTGEAQDPLHIPPSSGELQPGAPLPIPPTDAHEPISEPAAGGLPTAEPVDEVRFPPLSTANMAGPSLIHAEETDGCWSRFTSCICYVFRCKFCGCCDSS